MRDITTDLANLRRPRLLINAARFGLSDYRRERDLKRVIAPAHPSPALLDQLFCTESAIEAERQRGAASYCAARHIEVLVALLAEARLFTPRLAAV